MSTFTLNNLRFLNDIGDIEQFTLNEKNVSTIDGQSNNQEHINNSSSDVFKNKNDFQDLNNSTSSSSVEVEFDENIDVLNEIEPSEPSSFRTMDYSENLNDLDHPFLPVYTINTEESKIINQAEIQKNDEFFELSLEKTHFNKRTDRPKSALKRLHTPKSLNQYNDHSKLEYNENQDEESERIIKKVNESKSDEKKTLLNHNFWSSIEQDVLANNNSNLNKENEINKKIEFKETNETNKKDGKLQNFKVYDISEIGINNSKEKEFFFNDEDSFNKNEEDLYDNFDEESIDKIEEESFDKINEDSFEEEQSPSEEILSNHNDEQEIESKNNLFIKTSKDFVKQANEDLSIEKQESQGLKLKKKIELEKDNLSNLNLLNEIKKEFEKSIFENLNFNFLEKQIVEIKELIKNNDLEDSKLKKKTLVDHDFVKEELNKLGKVYSNNLQKIEKKLESLEFSFKNELDNLNKRKIKQFDDLFELLNNKTNEKENHQQFKLIENLINNLKNEIVYNKNDKLLNGEDKFLNINYEINEIKKNEKEMKKIMEKIDEKINLFLSENNSHKDKFIENQSKNASLNNENLNKESINSIENVSIQNNSFSLINEKLEQIQNTLKEIGFSQDLTKVNKLEDNNLTHNLSEVYQEKILEADSIKIKKNDSSFKLNKLNKEDNDICELAYNVRKNIRLFRSNFLRQKFLTLSSIMDTKTCLENLNLDSKKQNTNKFKNQNFFENNDNQLRISIKEAGKNLKEDVRQLKNLGNFDFSTDYNDNFRLRKIQLLRQEIDSKLKKLNQVIIN